MAVVLLACSPAAGFAQVNETTGSVEGLVLDTRGAPLSDISISLDGVAGRAVTDETGRFVLSSVPAGSYALIAEGDDGRAQEPAILVRAGETTRITLELRVETFELSPLLVSVAASSYAEERSAFGAKIDVPITDVPQSVHVITRDALDDRLTLDVRESIRAVSGINNGRSATNEIVIRGFNDNGAITNFSTGGSIFQLNGLRNYFGGYTTDIQLPNIERVEVLKGATGVLYGFNQPGGVINLVTKKPLPTPRYEASFAAGSWQRFRTAVDLTGPINDDRTLLYRLNVGFANSPDFRDIFFNRNVTVAPSLSYQTSPTTRVGLDLVFNRSDRLAWYDWGIPTRDVNGEDISQIVNEQYTPHQQGDFATLQNYAALVQVDHQLTEAWTLTSAASLSGNTVETEGHYPAFSEAVPTDDGSVGLRYRFFDGDRNGVFWTNYATGRFESGPLTHRLVVGGDIFDGSGKGREINAASDATLPDNVPPANVYDPDFSRRLTSNYVFNGGFGTPRAVSFVAGYAQDLISISERVQAMLGLRFERYENTLGVGGDPVVNEPVLPNVGVVVSLLDGLSVYGSYSESFAPQLTQDENVGGPFDPLEGRQLEAGLKRVWFGGRLVSTGSVYRIRRVNELVTANDPANPERLQQTGETRSHGVEVDITGMPVANWSVIWNYAYNRARVTESDDPSIIDVQLPNAPRHMSALWTRYDIRGGPLDGIGLGGGYTFVGERVGGFEGTEYPSYTTYDVAAYLQRGSIEFSAVIKNVTDEFFISGVWSDFYSQRGLPRNLMISARVRY